MEKDFHYYCLGILARASGFAPEEALTIAYASQYVDDCTESEPIKVGDMIFDPVRTSHYASYVIWVVDSEASADPFSFSSTWSDSITRGSLCYETQFSCRLTNPERSLRRSPQPTSSLPPRCGFPHPL